MKLNKGGRPRKYPEMWICDVCGHKFPNITGRPRRYCSQRCYGRLLSKRPPPGVFRKGKRNPYGQVDSNLKTHRRERKETNFNTHQKKEIAQKDDYKCQECGKQFPRLPIYKLKGVGIVFDHRLSVWKGGETTVDNGQVLCHPCDNIKNKREARERWDLWINNPQP